MVLKNSIASFRKQVIRTSLFSAGSAGEAVERLGFVQADPIRCPARAQDLILRQRVRGYRAGDLERRYPVLPLEECFLFAYGFATRDVWGWMHPKPQIELSEDHLKVLRLLDTQGPMHPRDLEQHLGVRSGRNGWGGTSRTSKLILERLHGRGLIRVAGRQNGNRVYRFEVYVPAAKRTLGYYAMPVLWREDVLGWANASVKHETLRVEFGFAKGRADTKAFCEAAEKEVEAMAAFLGLGSGCWKTDFRG